jgi:hypothetical protein
MKKLIATSLTSIFLFAAATAQQSSITLWKEGAIGALWNARTATVAYGKPDAKGNYKIYISDSLGNNEKQITFPSWLAERHQFPQEWDVTGQYLFCYVEKNEYAKEKGHKRKAADAIPGYGAYTDLWLLKRDGSRAWQLTNLPNNYSSGIIHGAISKRGKLFAWTERIGVPNMFKQGQGAGSYVFKVADFTFDSIPTLSNIRSFQPGGVVASGELESISSDDSCLAFYSTFEKNNLFSTPIYTLNIYTGKIKKLATESFNQCPTYTPDGKSMVYMTGHQADMFPFQVKGADWWIMNADGTNKRRLTFMNKRNHPQSVNRYRLAGTVSFINDHAFFGDVMTKPLGLTGQIVKVVW